MLDLFHFGAIIYASTTEKCMDANIQMVAVRPMTTFPTKTGRYAVFHRGRVCGDAYFWAQSDIDSGNYHMPETIVPGWQQLPHWGATHWIDLNMLDIPMDSDHKRFWGDANGFPTEQHVMPVTPSWHPPKKKNWLQRLFS